MKKYWLTFHPDTFLWYKDTRGIIYNSSNFKHFTFNCSGYIKKLCDTLIDLEKLYTAELSEALLNTHEIKEWVEQIQKIEAGELSIQNGKNKKPVSYYPTLTIQNNIKHILWQDELGMGGEIIKNLEELIFYINGSPKGSDQLFKQVQYPLKSWPSLNFSSIESFIEKCKNTQLNKISFIGDIFKYKDYELLQKWILSHDYYVQLVLLSSQIKTDLTTYELFSNEKTVVTVIVDNYSQFSKKPDFVTNLSNHVNWRFPVSSMKQFEIVSDLIAKLELDNYEILPIYLGDNLSFFEENVFMSKVELKETRLTRREVFINMAINLHYFGKLTILPDKNLYASINEDPLGNLNTPIYDVIFKEITKGNSWMQTREVKPCKQCIYQWMCPSISDYEKVIGKPNLCHIHSSRIADKTLIPT